MKPTHIDHLGHYWHLNQNTDKWYVCKRGTGWVIDTPAGQGERHGKH